MARLDALLALLLTLLNRAKPLSHLTLRPRGHSVHQGLSQTPHPIGQSGRQRQRPRPPLLNTTGPPHPLRLCYREAQTGVRQANMMGGLEQGQLVMQSRFVLAKRVDPSPDRRRMLAKVEIQPLHKARIDGPTSLG
jgi:hypothetical protein